MHTDPIQPLRARHPGNLITTAYGREIDLDAPRMADIDIASIAHSLSQTNRFTGHALRPYSVAEHSLLVAEIARRDLGLDVHGQFAALMHDAHEAYCGDLSTPGKRAVGPAWAAFEGRLERMVHCAFAINTPARAYAAEIKRADLIALATEKRDLLPATTTNWPCLSGIPALGWVDLRARYLSTRTWSDWRNIFANKYHELDYARNQALFGCTRHEPNPETTATETQP